MRENGPYPHIKDMTTTPRPTSTCRGCRRRRRTYPMSRFGGGSYKRGGRWNPSSICAECAVEAMRYAPLHAGASSSNWSVFSLERLVEKFEDPSHSDHTAEAVEVMADYRARKTAQEARKA